MPRPDDATRLNNTLLLYYRQLLNQKKRITALGKDIHALLCEMEGIDDWVFMQAQY